MKLIVFGATGTVGRHIVAQALQAGHNVTAFSRSAGKLQELDNGCLYLVTGDVLDEQAVANAIKGHDAVFCALGAGRNGNVRATGTANIIKGMQTTGVKRLICQTTLGCGDSWNNLNFFWKHIMFGWFLKDAFADHELQEQYIMGSNLAWSIVRPGAFTNGALTGKYKQGFPSNEKGLALKISRADLAFFMLAQLASDKYVRQTVSLSY